MPRKKHETPLRRRYSDDLKEHVIHQAFTLGKKSMDVAVDLDSEMPLRVVQVEVFAYRLGICRSTARSVCNEAYTDQQGYCSGKVEACSTG
jgi:transposase-like protein